MAVTTILICTTLIPISYHSAFTIDSRGDISDECQSFAQRQDQGATLETTGSSQYEISRPDIVSGPVVDPVLA